MLFYLEPLFELLVTMALVFGNITLVLSSFALLKYLASREQFN